MTARAVEAPTSEVGRSDVARPVARGEAALPARAGTQREALLGLQRQAGNAAVCRLVAARHEPSGTSCALRVPAVPVPPAPPVPAPEASPADGPARHRSLTVAGPAADLPTPPPPPRPQTTVVARSSSPTVVARAAPTVQRGILGRIGGAISSAAGAVAGLASGVKDRVLRTMAGWARRVPGYGLLCVILGRDVVTGTAVPRTAVNIVGGFMGLIPGGEAMFANLQRSGAVARAAAWFSAEVPKLGLTWDAIRSLFSRAWDSLGARDLLNPSGAWQRIVGIFGPPLQRLKSFALAAGAKVMEFVVEGVLSLAGALGTQVMGILRRAGGVLTRIVRDPIGFARNLIAAVRGGLGRFMANIGTHLRTGLFAWLTGALRGVVGLPARFDWRGILSLVLQLLGATWQVLRGKLVRLLGEPRVALLERAVDWVQRIVTGGLGAIGERILSFATGLIDNVIGAIRDWVARSVVGAAITRLITMFNPAGAIIQAILAVYNTVKFFIERAQQIGALANAVFGSIAAIAGGGIGNAITAVETAMARALPVVLGFLARLIGLGDVSAPIRNVITRVRGLVDRALDRVVGWLAGFARRLRSRGRESEGGDDTRSPAEKQTSLRAAMTEAVQVAQRPGMSKEKIGTELRRIANRHRLRVLKTLEQPNGTFRIHGEVNPTEVSDPLPEVLTVPKAVAEIRQRLQDRRDRIELSVATLADAQQVIRSALPSAVEHPSPTPGSAYRSQTDMQNQRAFRDFRKLALGYHVDIKPYSVSEIRQHLSDEIVRVDQHRQRSRVELEYHYNNPAWSRRNEENRKNLEGRARALEERLSNLREIQDNFSSREPEWRRLEEEGVLYGHVTVNEEQSQHRTNPHVNVEGPVQVETHTEQFSYYVKVAIYVRQG